MGSISRFWSGLKGAAVGVAKSRARRSAQQRAEVQTEVQAQQATSTGRSPIVTSLGVLMVLVLVGLWLTEEPEQSSSTERNRPAVFGPMDALTMCQSAMKAVARDPETAKVPFVQPVSMSDHQYLVSWGRSTTFMRMRNGLGLEVAVSGSCLVDAASKRVVGMTFDGQTLF